MNVETTTDPAVHYREAREEVLENLRAGIERHVAEAMESIERCEDEAREVLRQYTSDVEELAAVRRERTQACWAVETVPTLAWTANLEGDGQKERELRGEFAAAKRRVPELERRESDLKQRLDGQVRGNDRLLDSWEGAVRRDALRPANRTASHADENLRKRLLEELPAIVEEATKGLRRKRGSMGGGSSPNPRGQKVAQIERLHSH